MDVKLIKEDKSGKVYQADNFKIFHRKKDSVSGDNEENPKELIYLITGSAEFTLEEETKSVEAPFVIEIPEKTYHKILAITDISFIIF